VISDFWNPVSFDWHVLQPRWTIVMDGDPFGDAQAKKGTSVPMNRQDINGFVSREEELP
jgi:hypothetical protein